MPTDHILALLIQERDKLNSAIAALTGGAKRRGRPPKNPQLFPPEMNPQKVSKRKPFSAATKRKMAAAQKKRWAVKKAE
jgi:hypothetical protein